MRENQKCGSNRCYPRKTQPAVESLKVEVRSHNDNIEAGNDPQHTDSKKMRPQSKNHKDLNSAVNPNEQGNESSPRASREECNPVNTLILAQ